MFVLFKYLSFLFLGVIILNYSVVAFEVSLPHYKSLYVLDGDSVNIKTRLKGIDTPEIRQTCQKKQFKVIDCGRLSQQYLRKLLKKTSGKIQLSWQGFDDYYRALISLKKGELDIAKQMVLDGYAFSYYNYPDEQQQAKVNKRGFWGFFRPPEKPSKWRRENRTK